MPRTKIVDRSPVEVLLDYRDRGDTLAIEFLLVEMQRHRLAQRRQGVAEADQLVVLGTLLLGPIVRAVEVLLPAPRRPAPWPGASPPPAARSRRPSTRAESRAPRCERAL